MTRDCEYCYGTGVVPQTSANYVPGVNPRNRSSYPCKNCAGRGKYEVAYHCLTCKDTKILDVDTMGQQYLGPCPDCSLTPAESFSAERAEKFARSLLQYYPDRVDSGEVTNLALAYLKEKKQNAHQ